MEGTYVRQNSVRRRLAAAVALIVVASGLTMITAAPASATPRPLGAPGDSGDDGEGGSKTVIGQLEAASRGFVEARQALARSKTKQQELAERLKQAEADLAPKQAALDGVARQAYQVGRLGPMSALFTADTSAGLLDRAQTLAVIAAKQEQILRDLTSTRQTQQRAKTAIDATVRDQQKQLSLMAKRKKQAEDALKAANAGADADAPTGASGGSTRAQQGPGGSGGCTVDDPTSSGCITPRLSHALQQSKNAGFTRFVACYRPQNSGEHPKGRACDFAADKNTFGGDATGASKDYGNRLANYFVNNADPLGVLYVIWYRQIWLPSSGWKSYSGAGGDPSSDHTNHVHLSVR
jgi:phage shock protein A